MPQRQEVRMMTYEQAEKLLSGLVKAREVSKKPGKAKPFTKYNGRK